MRGTPDSPANRAARRVLVDGIFQSDAVKETGASRATVSDAVKRYGDAHQLIQSVYGVKRGRAST
ncbi:MULTISPECIES: transcriptional regulator KorA [Pseudomonas syringae group]|uniref:transcriptional regulator KorA n=1 Tax=Pseudomonas syringae group TaxID=136849 RepID=UPI002180582B|nr:MULTISPECIES: transcriptional regulator KorA [Pseudomonas syringae group]